MIRKGILKAFVAGTYLASVQIIGSLSVYLDNVPTSTAIAAADMVVGRNVAVLFIDPSNFSDAVIIAVWPGTTTGGLFVFLPQTAAHVEVTSGATTPMTCLINGTPTPTSVVYDTEANEMDWIAGRNGRLVVWNSTRGTGRLVSAINKATNTMTTVSTADAWANNDVLTMLSQTVGHAYIDIDMVTASNPAIPSAATGLQLQILIREQTAIGANEDLIIHPTSTWYVGSEQYLKCQVLNIFASLVVNVPLVNNRISYSVRAGTNVYVVVTVVGYWL